MATLRLPDPYEGWSGDQLKARLRKISGSLMEWQLIAANLAVAPGALDNLHSGAREKVEAIMEAYSD